MDNTENNKIESITTAYVDELINFEPTDSIKKAGIGTLQKEGTVALFNMLVKNGVAYLADEVGMGKTYIALAVMNLLRYQKPDARVLVITPRRNIQEKWSTDLTSFVDQNWLYPDHRVKTPHGSPDWPVVLPERLSDWINKLDTEEPHDTILRMSSFSLGIEQENSAKEIDRFQSQIPKSLRSRFDEVVHTSNQADFSEAIRECLKPYQYDLIIVDESHNLKYGYVPRQPSSIRNRSIYEIFGKAALNEGLKPWLLLLSATPMENGEPMSLVRQFQVFGRDGDLIRGGVDDTSKGYPISALASPEQKNSRELQKKLIVRRVGELKLKDESTYSRNMYRREWRKGGVQNPESPMSTPKQADQLVHAVLQKNVFDMLEAQSSGKFRIGALESFEIYSGVESSITDDNYKESEAKIADQHIISKLCNRYRESFSREVPHPKLNAVTELLARHIESREKALVFVRRVATTTDLAMRAAAASDNQIIENMREVVNKQDTGLVEEVEAVWTKKRATRQFNNAEQVARHDEDNQSEFSDESEEVDLKEAVPSFYTWFFRGKHRDLNEFPNIYSGRRLREQLFVRSRFSLILEENYVDWVLKRPDDLLGQLSADTKKEQAMVLTEIIECISNQFVDEDNFRRSFHCVQYAALTWMIEQECYKDYFNQITILLDEVFDDVSHLPQGNETIDDNIVSSLLTTLGVYPQLARTKKDSLAWEIVARGVFERDEEQANFDFRLAIRRREQIRHMQMALMRHGAPLIDLYLAVITSRGGELKTEREFAEEAGKVARELAKMYVQHAETEKSWRSSGGWELLEIKENFELLRKLNFPTLDIYNEIPRPLDAVFEAGRRPRKDFQDQLRTVRELLNMELSLQSPTAAAVGGQNDQRRHRITTQFRMPGMPWVVVATNVYEEGVDLHTYCKTVVHHGISHTASSVEQRTGRVDRIGGLLQRKAAEITSAGDFLDEHKIQSLFPYPNDTFEKFQVRRVLANCNRFLHSLHDMGDLVEVKEMTTEDKEKVPEQITEHLKSPFDVSESPWLEGILITPDHNSKFDVEVYNNEITKLETQLSSKFMNNYHDPGGQGLDRHYQINNHELRISPRSHREGDHLVIHISVNDNSTIIDAHPSGEEWCGQALKYLLDMLEEK